MNNINLLELIVRFDKDSVFFCEVDQMYYVTSEFLVGSFAGRAFASYNLDQALTELNQYLIDHINHDSMVGNIVTKSCYPDRHKTYIFLKEDKKNETRQP